jgi:hypothetical protein
MAKSGGAKSGIFLFAVSFLLSCSAALCDSTPFTDEAGVVYEDESRKILLRCPRDIQGHFAIPDGVLKVDAYAFEMCKALTSLSVPASVEKLTLGKSNQFALTALASFEVNPENKYYSSRDGVLFDKIHSIALRCPPRKTGHYSIPQGVIDIFLKAFAGCSGLTSVSFPEGLSNIHAGAFTGCSGLQRLDLPNSLTEIGKSAFQGCTGLKAVVFPERLVQIEDEAFAGCAGLESMAIPDGIFDIGKNAFAGCDNLKSVRIPEIFHDQLEVLGFTPTLAAKIRSESD